MIRSAPIESSTDRAGSTARTSAENSPRWNETATASPGRSFSTRVTGVRGGPSSQTTAYPFFKTPSGLWAWSEAESRSQSPDRLPRARRNAPVIRSPTRAARPEASLSRRLRPAVIRSTARAARDFPSAIRRRSSLTTSQARDSSSSTRWARVNRRLLEALKNAVPGQVVHARARRFLDVEPQGLLGPALEILDPLGEGRLLFRRPSRPPPSASRPGCRRRNRRS